MIGMSNFKKCIQCRIIEKDSIVLQTSINKVNNWRNYTRRLLVANEQVQYVMTDSYIQSVMRKSNVQGHDVQDHPVEHDNVQAVS